MRRIALAVVALLAIATAALPWIRTLERGPLDDAARADAPGEFVELSQGRVHVLAEGSDDAAVVVLVHGFSVPSYVWGPLPERLSTAGFAVLRYDLYGRGYSDRPDLTYDRDLFANQLLELLDARGIERAHLVGLSMGGAVVGRFTARHPERVRRLGLMAPVSVARDISPLDWPVVGEWMNRVWLLPKLADSQLSDFVRPERHPGWAERFRPQMRYDGFGHALLSSLRNVMTQDSLPDFREIADHAMPVLLIWGRRDSVLPFAQSEAVREAIPAAQFLAVDEAGHLPHLEQTDTVATRLIAFLREDGMQR